MSEFRKGQRSACDEPFDREPFGRELRVERRRVERLPSACSVLEPVDSSRVEDRNQKTEDGRLSISDILKIRN